MADRDLAAIPGDRRLGAYRVAAEGEPAGVALAAAELQAEQDLAALVDNDPGDQQSAEEELSADAESNPFRFEGFYYDSAIQSYDMQARQYRPDSGTFLSQDRFESAGADLALQSDPLTQNRYVFAGGNPVSNVEFDGHKPIDCKYCDSNGAATDNPSTKANEAKLASQGKAVPAGSLSYTGPTSSAAGQIAGQTKAYTPVETQVQRQVVKAAAKSDYPLEQAEELRVHDVTEFGQAGQRYRIVCYGDGDACSPKYRVGQPLPLPPVAIDGPSAGEVAGGAFDFACGSSTVEKVAFCGTAAAGRLISLGGKVPELVRGIRALFVAGNVVSKADIAAHFAAISERSQALRGYFFGGARGEEGRMAGVRALGQEGEAAAGIVKNTQRIPSATGAAAYRIPDELGNGLLGEVKNVKSLSYTKQLQDFSNYAQTSGLRFNLYVRRSTTFSEPLQQLIDSGAINRVPSLGP